MCRGNSVRPQIQAVKSGISDFDRTHRLVVNFVWFPKKVYSGDSRVAERLFNDWQFSGIVTVQSGIPFSVISTSGAAVYNRADLVRAGNGARQGSVKSRLDACFDPTAFAISLATAPPFGSSSRNITTGNSYKATGIGGRLARRDRPA